MLRATPTAPCGTFPAASGKSLGSTPPILRGSQDVILASKWGPLAPATPEQAQIQEHTPLPFPQALPPTPLHGLAPWPLSEGGSQAPPGPPSEGMPQLQHSHPLALLSTGVCRCLVSSVYLPSSSAFLLNTVAWNEKKFSFFLFSVQTTYCQVPTCL